MSKNPYGIKPGVRKGSEHFGAKLSEKDIVPIFEARREGKTQAEIAKSFGVSKGAISLVLSRKGWKAVPIPAKLLRETSMATIDSGVSLLRATPPKSRARKDGNRTVRINMDADTYRAAYEQAIKRNASLTEAIKQIIREASDNE